MRLKSREDAMIKTRKTKFPPILLIYLSVVLAFGALVATRIHAADDTAFEARMVVPSQTASL
jgi:hypothetical protein